MAAPTTPHIDQTSAETNVTTTATAQLAFQALDRQDLTALDRLETADVDIEFRALGLVCRGRQEVRDFYKELYGAFPDFRISELNLTVSGTSAVTEWVATGMFTGTPYQGIRATGRPMAVRGVTCSQIRNGRIAQQTVYYDGADFARQARMLPPMHSRRERMIYAAFNTGTRLRRMLRRGGDTQQQVEPILHI